LLGYSEAAAARDSLLELVEAFIQLCGRFRAYSFTGFPAERSL